MTSRPPRQTNQHNKASIPGMTGTLCKQLNRRSGKWRKSLKSSDYKEMTSVINTQLKTETLHKVHMESECLFPANPGRPIAFGSSSNHWVSQGDIWPFDMMAMLRSEVSDCCEGTKVCVLVVL